MYLFIKLYSLENMLGAKKRSLLLVSHRQLLDVNSALSKSKSSLMLQMQKKAFLAELDFVLCI